MFKFCCITCVCLLAGCTFKTPAIADRPANTGAIAHSLTTHAEPAKPLLHEALRARALTAASTDPLDTTLTLADIRHLTQRTGFGTTVDQFKALQGLTRREAVGHIVEGLRSSPQQPMPAWTQAPAPRFWSLDDYRSDELQRFHEQRDLELSELRQWWLSEMLQTDSPQTERLVLFWHDHFATNYHDIDRQSIAMARQNETFRTLGTGSYRTLLKAMIRDAALLNYLDNTSNKAGSPNENFGRELLELFTLGEGHYTEQDVKSAARALTGYHISAPYNLQFRVATWDQDTDNKPLFNRLGPFDGDDLIDLILQQPAAARHLARKFWSAYVSDTAPDETIIQRWADTFKESNFDLTTLYRTVLESPAFWAQQYRASIIKSPVQLLVGLSRSLEYPKIHWQSLSAASARLGMELFAPPNVAGWSEGAGFVAPGHLLSRHQILHSLMTPEAPLTDSGGMMTMNPPAMTDATGMNPTGMNPMAMNAASEKAWLHLTASAEAYEGDVDYRVDLESDTGVLWSTGTQTFERGYDTQLLGPARYRTDLPWRVIAISPPESVRTQTTRVRVHFLNDAAGDTGDRNFYVSGLQYEDRWIDSATSAQDSLCPPENSDDSGSLYCEGHTLFTLPESNLKTTQSIVTDTDFTARSAHIWWMNHADEQQQNTLGVTLQHVTGPSSFHNTLGFTLQREPDGSIVLRLQRFACWPECVEPWPACSWRNAATPPSLTVSFPFSRQHSNSDLDCHYTSLAENDQLMVDALWNSIDTIVSALAASPRALKFDNAMRDWQQWLQEHREGTDENRYSKSGATLTILSTTGQGSVPAGPRPLSRSEIRPPVISTSAIQQLTHILDDRRLNLAHWLLAGLDLHQLPEFDHLSDLAFHEQIGQLLKHPVLQVQ